MRIAYKDAQNTVKKQRGGTNKIYKLFHYSSCEFGAHRPVIFHSTVHFFISLPHLPSASSVSTTHNLFPRLHLPFSLHLNLTPYHSEQVYFK
jgi:hypothetical protein